MMTIEKNLSNALGIEPKPRKRPSKDVVILEPIEPVEHDTKDEDEDYILVRTTLRSLIETGNDAISEIASLAKQNESARSFEVCSTLIKTVGETAKDLYSLQKTKRELKESVKDPRLKGEKPGINVEQAVFVGSAADLLNKIKEKKND